MDLVSLLAVSGALLSSSRQAPHNDPGEAAARHRPATAVLRIAVTGCEDKIVTIEDGKPFKFVATNPVDKNRRVDPEARFCVYADINGTARIAPADCELKLTGMSHLLLSSKGFSGGSRSTFTAQSLRVAGQPIVSRAGQPGRREVEIRVVVERVDSTNP